MIFLGNTGIYYTLIKNERVGRDTADSEEKYLEIRKEHSL